MGVCLLLCFIFCLKAKLCVGEVEVWGGSVVLCLCFLPSFWGQSSFPLVRSAGGELLRGGTSILELSLQRIASCLDLKKPHIVWLHCTATITTRRGQDLLVFNIWTLSSNSRHFINNIGRRLLGSQFPKCSHANTLSTNVCWHCST